MLSLPDLSCFVDFCITSSFIAHYGNFPPQCARAHVLYGTPSRPILLILINLLCDHLFASLDLKVRNQAV